MLGRWSSNFLKLQMKEKVYHTHTNRVIGSIAEQPAKFLLLFREHLYACNLIPVPHILPSEAAGGRGGLQPFSFILLL